MEFLEEGLAQGPTFVTGGPRGPLGGPGLETAGPLVSLPRALPRPLRLGPRRSSLSGLPGGSAHCLLPCASLEGHLFPFCFSLPQTSAWSMQPVLFPSWWWPHSCLGAFLGAPGAAVCSLLSMLLAMAMARALCHNASLAKIPGLAGGAAAYRSPPPSVCCLALCSSMDALRALAGLGSLLKFRACPRAFLVAPGAFPCSSTSVSLVVAAARALCGGASSPLTSFAVMPGLAESVATT